MDLYMVYIIIIWCLLGTDQSSDYIINCLSDKDCFISCDVIQSCMNAIINCPINGDCNIYCFAERACQDIIINATYSSGNLNILCQASNDDCRRMKIYGSTLHSNTGHLTLICNGTSASCMSSYINCPVSGDCMVSCNGYRGCEDAVITSSINGDLNVYCNAQRACSNAIFDGTYSFKLDVRGCKQYQSCSDLSIYCPPNPNYIARCIVDGNDNLGPRLQIYAVNGWSDVYIDYNDTFNGSYDGKMFCGYGYNISCNIASNNWSCVNIDDYCNKMYIQKVSTSQSTVTLLPCQTNMTLQIMNETLIFVGDLHNELKHYQDAINMLVIGGGLVFMALCCVIYGTITKQIWKRNIEKKTQEIDHKMFYINQASEVNDETDGDTDIDQEQDIEINVFPHYSQKPIYKRNEQKSEDINNNETSNNGEIHTETNAFQRYKTCENSQISEDTDKILHISQIYKHDKHIDYETQLYNGLYSWIDDIENDANVDIDLLLKQLEDNDEDKEVPALLKDYQL